MNILRRYTLHRWNSRHNPLTRIASICTLLAIATAALTAGSELLDLRAMTAADRSMLAQLLLVIEGRANLVERTGQYEVVYSVNKTTYEVR